MLSSHHDGRGAVSRREISRIVVGACVAALIAARLLPAQADTRDHFESTSAEALTAEPTSTPVTPAPASAAILVVSSGSVVDVSVGMDATAISSKLVSSLPTTGRQFTLLAPAPYVRLEVNFGSTVQLEVPLSVSLTHTSGQPTAKDVQVGVLGNLYFVNNPTGVRPFLGAGGLYHLYSPGGSYSSSQTQFGAQAQFGLAVPITPNFEFRPALLYQHWFAHTADSLPAQNGFGGALGLTWRFRGGNAFMPRTPCETDFRIGFGLEHSFYGSYAGTTPLSETNFFFPSPYVGVFFPLASEGRLAIGSTISAQYTSFSGSHAYNLELQPRFEYNLFPTWRTSLGVRLGAQFDFQRQKFLSNAANIYGAGVDAVLTVPFSRRVNYFAGVGYDYKFKNTSAGVPAENTVSLKLGLDARPWGT